MICTCTIRYIFWRAKTTSLLLLWCMMALTMIVFFFFFHPIIHMYIDSAILRNNNAYRWIWEPEPFLVVKNGQCCRVCMYVYTYGVVWPPYRPRPWKAWKERVENLFPRVPLPPPILNPIQLSQSITSVFGARRVARSFPLPSLKILSFWTLLQGQSTQPASFPPQNKVIYTESHNYCMFLIRLLQIPFRDIY